MHATTPQHRLPYHREAAGTPARTMQMPRPPGRRRRGRAISAAARPQGGKPGRFQQPEKAATFHDGASAQPFQQSRFSCRSMSRRCISLMITAARSLFHCVKKRAARRDIVPPPPQRSRLAPSLRRSVPAATRAPDGLLSSLPMPLDGARDIRHAMPYLIGTSESEITLRPRRSRSIWLTALTEIYFSRAQIEYH